MTLQAGGAMPIDALSACEYAMPALTLGRVVVVIVN